MHKGDVIDDFVLFDETGAERRLSEFSQMGPVVLFCYPLAMSKGCTVESCHFRDLAAEFAELSASRIGLSADSVERQAEFSRRNALDYPLLSDTEGVVTAKLGVKRNIRLLPVRRWTFLIDTDRSVLDVIKNELSMQTHADRAIQVLRVRAERLA